MVTILGLVLVAFLWGVTNPFIKKSTSGLQEVKAASYAGQLFAEIVFLITNWRYVVPFALNQCGSVLYFVTLQTSPLSLAVPVANSLSLVFTALTGWLMGEEPLTHRTKLGTALVVAGTTLCFLSKS